MWGLFCCINMIQLTLSLCNEMFIKISMNASISLNLENQENGINFVIKSVYIPL